MQTNSLKLLIFLYFRDNLPSIILGQRIISRKSNAQDVPTPTPVCIQLDKTLSGTSEYRYCYKTFCY